MACLASLDGPFEALDARGARPSIPPEQLLRAALLQILGSVRSERQLVEQLDVNRLFRWFVGVGIDEGVWGHSTVSKPRERLFDEGLARHVLRTCRVAGRLAGPGLR
jgi:transposase